MVAQLVVVQVVLVRDDRRDVGLGCDRVHIRPRLQSVL